MSNKRREGFDYFIDKCELSYPDYELNDVYNNPRFRDEMYPGPGVDRFRKFNRYTGEAIGSQQYIENSINTIYRDRENAFDNNRGGTVEFSAIPGQGGLNPNRRPLGDETMLFSNVSSRNPYVARYMENQQQNSAEINKRIDMLNSQINTVVQKIDDVSRVINDEIRNTGTLSFSTNTNTMATGISSFNNTNTTNLGTTATTNLGVENTKLVNTPSPSLDATQEAIATPLAAQIQNTQMVDNLPEIDNSSLTTTTEVTKTTEVTEKRKMSP